MHIFQKYGKSVLFALLGPNVRFKLFYYANFLSYLGSGDFHFYSFGIHNLMRIKTTCFEVPGQRLLQHLEKCTGRVIAVVAEMTGTLWERALGMARLDGKEAQRCPLLSLLFVSKPLSWKSSCLLLTTTRNAGFSFSDRGCSLIQWLQVCCCWREVGEPGVCGIYGDMTLVVWRCGFTLLHFWFIGGQGI